MHIGIAADPVPHLPSYQVNPRTKLPMTILTAGLLSVAVISASIASAEAAKARKVYRKHCDAYCQRYPSATPRQLNNARAYDRGEYWEQDPDAHPVGSPGWWYLKDRGRDGGLRF
jgi:hypothetical protein